MLKKLHLCVNWSQVVSSYSNSHIELMESL
jgi:hypothetical protein